MNSRPPPCEGDALPAELLPHMDATTRRSVVCMPFTCRGQVFFVSRPSSGRERGAWCCGKKGQAATKMARQAGGHELASVAVRMERACVLSAAVRSSSLDRVQPDPATPVPPPWGLRKGATLRSRAAGKCSDRQDSGASTGPCPPVSKFHATLGKAHGIPGSAPSVHPCKKIGRAASVGLGYREKKRYRSPLVSL